MKDYTTIFRNRRIDIRETDTGINILISNKEDTRTERTLYDIKGFLEGYKALDDYFNHWELEE